MLGQSTPISYHTVANGYTFFAAAVRHPIPLKEKGIFMGPIRKYPLTKESATSPLMTQRAPNNIAIFKEIS